MEALETGGYQKSEERDGKKKEEWSCFEGMEEELKENWEENKTKQKTNMAINHQSPLSSKRW